MRVFLNTKSTKIFLIIIENIFKVHKGVKLNEDKILSLIAIKGLDG